MIKRVFDIVVAAVGLLLVSPLMIAVVLLVKLSSPGPALFKQERIGRHFRPFIILKFRTMVQDAPSRGGPITSGADPRITKIGSLLRKCKIDEIPQLINVLRGDMSLVGQGPEKETLQKRARELGLDNIVFLPPIPRSSIPTLLTSADALYIG